MSLNNQKGNRKAPALKELKKTLLEQILILQCFSLFFLAGAVLSFLSGCKSEHCFYYSCGALALAALVIAAVCAKREGKNGILVGVKKQP